MGKTEVVTYQINGPFKQKVYENKTRWNEVGIISLSVVGVSTTVHKQVIGELETQRSNY